MAKVTVTIDIAGAVDPFAVNTTRSKAAKLMRYRALLDKLITGVPNRAGARPTLRVGTGTATCTATLVTPVTGNVLSINTKALTAAQLHARVKATLVSPVAGNVLTVNGVDFTGATGAVVLGAGTFSVDTSATAAATSLAAQINGHPSLAGVVTASSAAGVVNLRAVATGVGGNALTVTKTGAPITLNATGGGADTGVFQGGAAPSGDQWDYGDTDTQAAVSLAACVNRSVTAGVANVVEATSAAGVVTVSSSTKGVGGNDVAVAKTGAPITLAGLTAGLLTGGTSTVFTF